MGILFSTLLFSAICLSYLLVKDGVIARVIDPYDRYLLHLKRRVKGK